MKKSQTRVNFMRLTMRIVLICWLVIGNGAVMLGQSLEAVERVVKWQLENYPESRLTDLYKNFFQDKFGPGHMVADTASAGAYIRRELALMRSESGGKVVGLTQREVAEITGWEGKFVRVDMAVIDMGIISYKIFSDAFFESSRSHILPDVKEWANEWFLIEKIIKDIAPQINGFEEDSALLRKLLGNGEYVVHHSREYSEAYRPHYRLIKREIWERVSNLYEP